MKKREFLGEKLGPCWKCHGNERDLTDNFGKVNFLTGKNVYVHMISCNHQPSKIRKIEGRQNVVIKSIRESELKDYVRQQTL